MSYEGKKVIDYLPQDYWGFYSIWFFKWLHNEVQIGRVVLRQVDAETLGIIASSEELEVSHGK